MLIYIANIFFILLILFCLYIILVSRIYRDKPSNDLSGQSERQEKNNDYNIN